jgi:hypothetical protein
VGGAAAHHNPDDDVGIIGKIQFFKVPWIWRETESAVLGWDLPGGLVSVVISPRPPF